MTHTDSAVSDGRNKEICTRVYKQRGLKNVLWWHLELRIQPNGPDQQTSAASTEEDHDFSACACLASVCVCECVCYGVCHSLCSCCRHLAVVVVVVVVVVVITGPASI